MFLYIHVLGCWWFYLVAPTKDWVPNMDFIIINYPEPAEFELYYAEPFRKYWKSFYTGIYIFGVGEICAVSTFQLIFAASCMLFSAMVNANILGNMAVLV